MEILDSVELRWFFGDDVSATPARDWFKSTASEGKRTDSYLVTGRDDVGFKARGVDGEPIKVEAKYLLESLGVVEGVPGMSGRLECWRKLSLTFDDPNLRADGIWISIQKDRRLRKFAVVNGEASEVPVKSRVDAGCGLELTQLWRKGRNEQLIPVGWTLGLEAFGPEEGRLNMVMSTCRAAHDMGLCLKLTEGSSMSYPKWLRKLEP